LAVLVHRCETAALALALVSALVAGRSHLHLSYGLRVRPARGRALAGGNRCACREMAIRCRTAPIRHIASRRLFKAGKVRGLERASLLHLFRPARPVAGTSDAGEGQVVKELAMNRSSLRALAVAVPLAFIWAVPC